jgi:hypothetical protein
VWRSVEHRTPTRRVSANRVRIARVAASSIAGSYNGARHFGHCLSAATDLDRGFSRYATTDAGNSIGDGIERLLNRVIQRDDVLIEGERLIAEISSTPSASASAVATLSANAAGPRI